MVPLLAALFVGSGCGESSPEPASDTATDSPSPTPGATGTPTTTGRPAITYTVQPGDNLRKIADRFGITVAALLAANPTIEDNVVNIGDVLSVPDPLETPPASDAADAVTLLTLVDKQHSLPSDYVPQDLAELPAQWVAPGAGAQYLREDADTALTEMLQAARDAGIDIKVQSSYRSFATQEETFQYWVSTLGEEEARRISAEAGHSEHQLGTTVDLTSADVGHELVESFASTPAGEWLLANGHRYGFALSYPAGKEAITGYAHEPWHYRYIGPEAALAWHSSGLTLGEYLASS